mmetsp:Transcript_6725/g.16412  ORF Transcript_6725/g.16412 Transcript_6725/m.16412 type:complete len:314 (-) Transcript_6725:247-1188(-)
MKILSLAAVALAALSGRANAFAGVTVAPKISTTTALAAAATADSTADSTADTNPRLSGLALALDDGTRKSHSMAENTAFVQGFFKGISSADSYKNLLTSLYYVYYAMEVEVMDAVSKVDSTEAQWILALDAAPLRRLQGLEKDMEYFYGQNWKQEMAPPSKGTQVYTGRIGELIATIDENDDDTERKSLLYLFVAHQYTRYLGDLFGGQMMGNMASRSMDLPEDGSGVAFYTFDNVPSTKDFITEWYTTLNDLGISTNQQQKIVDEANLVFSLNIGIFEELEGSPWSALWTMAVKSAREFIDWNNIKESKNKK